MCLHKFAYIHAFLFLCTFMYTMHTPIMYISMYAKGNRSGLADLVSLAILVAVAIAGLALCLDQLWGFI